MQAASMALRDMRRDRSGYTADNVKRLEEEEKGKKAEPSNGNNKTQELTERLNDQLEEGRKENDGAKKWVKDGTKTALLSSLRS